jgi:hypothetical protein
VADDAERWMTAAVFAGGAEHLDGALEAAVGPAVEAAREARALSRWSFERVVDGRGPHVHLQARTAQPLADAVAERLPEARRRRARGSLLPPPPSRAIGNRRVGVEPGGATADPGAADQLSSEVVVALLPQLADGRRRAGCGLALLRGLSVAEAGGREPQLWRALARHWVGDDERGDALFARLEALAGTAGARIAADADAWADTAELGLWREGLATLAGTGELEGSVARQAHLTCNRLGLSPLEEALIAVLLAGELATEAAPAPPPEPEPGDRS